LLNIWLFYLLGLLVDSREAIDWILKKTSLMLEVFPLEQKKSHKKIITRVGGIDFLFLSFITSKIT
jgi:hypothetical protein